MLTAERLRELLHYNPETGVFTWRVGRGGRRGGRVAGCLMGERYRVIRVDGVLHLAHRLAWLYVHSVWPPNQLDHRKGMRDDNRLAELRLATNAQNCQNHHCLQGNNTSGVTGVSWSEERQKWYAYITWEGKMRSLGRFDDMNDAIEYRELAEAMVHPYSKAAERLPTFTLAEWQARDGHL